MQQQHLVLFESVCQANGVTRSMSRSGNVCDRAAMESFFSLPED